MSGTRVDPITLNLGSVGYHARRGRRDADRRVLVEPGAGVELALLHRHHHLHHLLPGLAGHGVPHGCVRVGLLLGPCLGVRHTLLLGIGGSSSTLLGRVRRRLG